MDASTPIPPACIGDAIRSIARTAPAGKRGFVAAATGAAVLDAIKTSHAEAELHDLQNVEDTVAAIPAEGRDQPEKGSAP